MAPSDWSWNPEALLGVALAAGYAVAVRRYRAEWWRIACFLSACALLVIVWVTPMDTVAVEYLVVVHLWQNVVLAEWAPLLLVLGLPAALAARIARPRPVRVLTNPFVALPVWIANYAIWHVPVFYDTALRNPHSLLLLEHVLYLATGAAMWWCVWQDEPHRLKPQSRAAYVFAGFVLSAPLGLLLALVPEPLYDFYADAPERVWGLSLIADQQYGGITMATEQSIVFFAIFAYWFARFLQEEDHQPLDQAGARGRVDPR